MTTINWSLNLQVIGGMQIPISGSKSVEAYDKIEVIINPDSTEKSVDIQPSSANQVNLLFIKSNLYGPNITYKASDGTNDSESIILDDPQIFLSSGAISLLTVAPKILKFKNNHTEQDKKAFIEILVGRDATP